MRPVVIAEPFRTPENDGEFDRRIAKCTCGHLVRFVDHESEVVCPGCKQTVVPPAPETRKGILR
jgi:hypothetical protein